MSSVKTNIYYIIYLLYCFSVIVFYFVAHIFKCIIVAVINILLIYIYVFTVF